MRHKTTTIFLFFFVLTEILSGTAWTEYVPINFCRYAHFITGIGIFILLLIKPQENSVENRKDSKWVPWFLLAILLVWSIPKMNVLFIAHPLDFHQADMLPVIKTMCERWLSFAPVYTIIPEIWSGVLPVYLPALYLPYVPAVLLQFDMRWIGFVCTVMPLLYIILLRKSSSLSWLIFILLGLFFDFILHRRSEAFTLSEEGVVYGYYMMFAFFIYQRKYVAAGIIAACCLLSRYSGIFFIGALVACLWLMNQKREWKKYLSAGVITILILIIGGRAWSQLGQWIGLSTVYVQNILDNPAKYQNVLNDGIGLMPLIGLEHVHLVFYLQVILLILIAMVMIVWVKKFHHSFYYLAFLKLSLVVFYNLLILPYTYLMYTSVLVSIILFFLYANHDFQYDKNSSHGEIH